MQHDPEYTTMPYNYYHYENVTDGLPSNFMIEIDGKHYRPRCLKTWKSTFTPDQNISHWTYFESGARGSLSFKTFEDARQFILQWIEFLEWLDAIIKG